MNTTHINKTHTLKGIWMKLCLMNLTTLTIFVKHNLTILVKHNLTMFVKYNLTTFVKDNLTIFYKHNLTIIVKHGLTIFINTRSQPNFDTICSVPNNIITNITNSK